MRLKGTLLGLTTALTFCFGCGSDVKTPEAVQHEMAASAASDGAKAASAVSQSVLEATNLINGPAGLKLDATATGGVCPSTIDLTVNDGQLQIQGGCAAETTASGCAYRFDGILQFHSYQLAPKKVLDGGLNVIQIVTSPACSLDDGNATVALSTSPFALSPLTLNGAVIEDLQATLSLDSVVSSLSSRSRVGDFVCLSDKDSSTCFNDHDLDLIDDTKDNCLGTANPSQSDSDGDGVGDLCDNCPVTANTDQADGDGDGQGDACLHICAPGVALCETPSDCPSDLGCLNGCCQACPTEFISMACQEAEDINDATGVTGVSDSCDPFGHVCNTDMGCCEFPGFGEPFSLCSDTCGTVPGGDFDFCALLFQATVCVTPRCPSFSGPLGDDSGIGIDCSTHGQLACDQIIGNGLAFFDLICQDGCCVNGTGP